MSLLPILARAEDQPLECHLVVGVLNVWNGWPPNLRIEANDGVIYGVPEADEQSLIPDNLVGRLAKGPVSGGFTVCPLGHTTSVPYDERPIVLVSILDFDVYTK
jgi:hypothetical protein